MVCGFHPFLQDSNTSSTFVDNLNVVAVVRTFASRESLQAIACCCYKLAAAVGTVLVDAIDFGRHYGVGAAAGGGIGSKEEVLAHRTEAVELLDSSHPATNRPFVNGNIRYQATNSNKSSMMASSKRNYFFPQPAEIAHKNLRWLVTDRPHNANLVNYLELLHKHNVTDLVRVCESEYDIAPIEKAGVKVHNLEFPDGQYPPDYVVKAWFELIRQRFKQQPEACVAIHCVAGLGRAPVLVAIALIELGMSSEDAVELIRSKRRGAINTKQLEYLHRYKPKNRLKISPSSGGNAADGGSGDNGNKCKLM